MKKIHIFPLLLFVFVAKAQNLAPAKPQVSPIILKGGTAHLGNGTVITNSVILFENGKITFVGESSQTPAIEGKNAEVINVSGKEIYPGIISPLCQVGLTEVEAIRATNDAAEVNNFNPNVRALVAFNTDAELNPTLRSNGILVVQATPEFNGTMAGQSAIMHLDGWNWEDSQLKADDGIHLNFPATITRSSDNELGTRFVFKKNEKREEIIQELSKIFDDATVYKNATSTSKNLKLEAMQGLFDGSKNLYLYSEDSKGIIEAVTFAKKRGVKKIVVCGDTELLAIASFLKENNIPVILGATHALPNQIDDDIDLPYKLPALLQKNGLKVALSYAGLSWRVRNLPFLAGTAVAFGIEKEEALKMITANTAEILGIADKIGTLENGKHATLIVTAGDVLDMKTNTVEMAFIEGRKINLDDKQKRLYKKYQEKYELK